MITLNIHAVSALTVTVASVVRALKKRKWVLVSGFFMQLWLAWMAFSVLMFIVIPVIIPVSFMIFGVFSLIISYKVVGFAKNPHKSGFIPGFSTIFILSTEDSLAEAVPEYCMKYDKSENQLTDSDNDLIYEYAFNWILYIIVWIIKNDYYSDSFKSKLGDALIAGVKADIVFPDRLIYATSGILTDADVRAEIKPFLSSYAGGYREGSYWKDYSEVIKAEQNRYVYLLPKDDKYLEYCVNFNMNIYYEIEEKINISYYNFKNTINEQVAQRLRL